MALWTKDGVLVADGSGNLLDCADCPCEPPTTVGYDCGPCGTRQMPLTFYLTTTSFCTYGGSPPSAPSALSTVGTVHTFRYECTVGLEGALIYYSDPFTFAGCGGGRVRMLMRIKCINDANGDLGWTLHVVPRPEPETSCDLSTTGFCASAATTGTGASTDGGPLTGCFDVNDFPVSVTHNHTPACATPHAGTFEAGILVRGNAVSGWAVTYDLST